MTCEPWRDLLVHEGLDEISEARREEYLLHLDSCPRCRRAATLSDPTVAFSLLPTETVTEAEIEEIRRTVRALRRSRTLGSSRPSRWLAAGALAAMLAAVILLVPERSISPRTEEIPFAGAVGVGSGLIEVPQTAGGPPAVQVQIVLARSAKMVDLSRSPSLIPIAQTGLVALPGDRVEADLNEGFRIRFDLPDEMASGGPLLRNFELSQDGEHREVSLLRADLQPRPGSPLILGINPIQPGSEQLWLHLTSTVDRPTAQTAER